MDISVRSDRKLYIRVLMWYSKIQVLDGYLVSYLKDVIEKVIYWVRVLARIM